MTIPPSAPKAKPASFKTGFARSSTLRLLAQRAIADHNASDLTHTSCLARSIRISTLLVFTDLPLLSSARQFHTALGRTSRTILYKTGLAPPRRTYSTQFTSAMTLLHSAHRASSELCKSDTARPLVSLLDTATHPMSLPIGRYSAVPRRSRPITSHRIESIHSESSRRACADVVWFRACAHRAFRTPGAPLRMLQRLCLATLRTAQANSLALT